ncbi:MAG: hypothetical protein HQM12_05175 [SAR324 cluster bacterium]|nr:hypothetical protein [SAR324 cluster bacterium]
MIDSTAMLPTPHWDEDLHQNILHALTYCWNKRYSCRKFQRDANWNKLANSLCDITETLAHSFSHLLDEDLANDIEVLKALQLVQSPNLQITDGFIQEFDYWKQRILQDLPMIEPDRLQRFFIMVDLLLDNTELKHLSLKHQTISTADPAIERRWMIIWGLFGASGGLFVLWQLGLLLLERLP